uniref:Uncharacterized protein n=1 Tax=Oryza punctata TaxID=4537 RepID=A0A0E0M2V2_ORYPU
MGCCVSRSTAAAVELRRVAVDTTAAMVMDLDGTMALLEAPVAARLALGGDAYSCFVCSADELDFDAPARAMDADEALQPGQLYFVLPISVLRRPLSGHDMAALAVKASAALSSIGVDGLTTLTAAGVSTSPSSSSATRRKDRDGAAASGKRWKTSRVAPLAVVSGIDAYATQLMVKKTRKSLLQRITPMGSCVSRSTAAAASTPAITTTAKVVFQDGSMAQFAAPASTVRDALGGERASSSSSSLSSTCFVCCSDELRFDAAARAMAAHDALLPGQLYFVLPISALHRPLSGQDMAALAVKAIAALGASATAAAAGGGSSSSVSSRGKNARPAGKQRPQTTARVAPLVVADADHVYGGYDTHQKTVHGDRTARINGGGHRGSIAHQRAGLQKLSAISEGDE